MYGHINIRDRKIIPASLNISWTEKKEVLYSLRASRWTGHSFIVAMLLFQSYNMQSDHQRIILAALLVTFLHFSTSFSMEGHISVTSQITECGKSSLVSRYCRNYGFGSLKCPEMYCSNNTFQSWMLVQSMKHRGLLKADTALEKSGTIQVLVCCFSLSDCFLCLVMVARNRRNDLLTLYDFCQPRRCKTNVGYAHLSKTKIYKDFVFLYTATLNVLFHFSFQLYFLLIVGQV